MTATNLWQAWHGLDSACCLRLTEALAHFLWQGCAIAILYAVVERGLRRSPAAARYFAGVIAMLLMAACLPATLWLLPVRPAPTAAAIQLLDHPAATPSPLVTTPAGSEHAVLAPTIKVEATPDAIQPQREVLNLTSRWAIITGHIGPLLVKASPYASAIYLSGVALMLLRVSLGLWGGRRLRQACAPLADRAILEMIGRHARRMAIRVAPAVAYCRRISVPVVVGVLRPMILLPTSLASGLTFTQLEAVLLHELAHVRRYDLVVNVLQRLVEAMLFFHPAVWWVSRRISAERENACDDLVLRCDCSRLQYADALVRMAELCADIGNRGVIDRAALAATGGNASQFKRRVLRLLGVDEKPRLRLTTAGLLVPILLAALLVLVPFAWRIAYSAQDEANAKASSTEQRVLHFPLDRAMGVVYWRLPTAKADKWWVADDNWKKVGDAQGEVRVPLSVDVRLDIGKAASADLSGLDGLGADDIQGIDLRGTDVNDDGLAHVGRLGGLRLLDLESTRITDAGIQHLAGLKRLKQINLDAFDTNAQGFGAGDESMKVLAALPELQQVDLRLTKVTDAGMAELAKSKSLIHVGVPGTKVTDAGLAHLKQLPRLESLRLGVYDEGAKITDAGLKHVGEMLNLKVLDLSGTRITDEGLIHLQTLKRLEDLSLENTKVTEAGLANLEPLTSLERLRIYTKSPTTDIGAAHLAKLKSLRNLTEMLQVTGKGLAALATLPHLESLEGYGEGITDEAVRQLAHTKSLKWLSFQRCPLTDDGLAALAGLENLEIVDLYDTRVRGEGLKYLRSLPKLSNLDMVFDRFKPPPPDWRPTLAEVNKLTHLTSFKTGGKGLTNDDLAGLAGLKLESLSLEFPVNDQGALQVSRLTSLKVLDIRCFMTSEPSIITDEGLEHLSALHNLEHLSVEGRFTDKGVEHLARLKSLQYLVLGSDKVTKDAVQALASKLSSLREASYRGGMVPLPDFTITDKDAIRRYGRPQQRADLDELEDRPLPHVNCEKGINVPSNILSWFNGTSGKVLLVDFWGTWCKPCRELMPKLKSLHEKYHAQGLRILGIHTTNGAEKMADYVAAEKIAWPVAADIANETVKAWCVTGYPSLYLVDRAGKVRFAGVYEEDLEKAIVQLLAEKAPATEETAASEASPELAAQKAAMEALDEMGVMIYGDGPAQSMLNITKAPFHSAQLWKVPPRAWEYVGRLAPLEDLSIIASDARGSALEHLTKLKTLRKLTITNSQCTPLDLKHLAGCGELERLEVNFLGVAVAESNESLSEKLGDLTSEEQQRVEQLLETSKKWKVKPQEALRMARMEILTDRVLQSLSQLKHLKSLTLGNGKITCWGLEHLKDLQAIEEINVDVVAGPPRHTGLVLKGFPALRRFRYADVSDEFFAEIAGLAHLENLEVWANDLTDAGVPNLVKLTSLQKLAIRGSALTDNGLKALSKLPRLESLDIRFSDSITAVGIEEFKKSCPSCKVEFQSNAKPAANDRKSAPKEADVKSGDAKVCGQIFWHP